MPTQIVERPPIESEKASLSKFDLGQISIRQIRAALEEAFVFWFVLMGGLLLVWQLISWVVAKFVHADIGFHGRYVLPTLAIAALLFVTVGIWSMMRRIRAGRARSAKLRQDLERAVVLDERYLLTEARRFQEQEHGGLIYFLRTDENRVIVLYDSESQDLGARGEDPLSSSFAPCGELQMVRMPLSRIILSTQFSGNKLNAEEVWDLMLEPAMWPEDGEYCDCDWEELVSRYSKSK